MNLTLDVSWQASIYTIRQRLLKESRIGFSCLLLILGYLIVLSYYATFELNQYLGKNLKLTEMHGEKFKESPLWLSISPKNQNQLIVETIDRQVFTLDLAKPHDDPELQKLIQYLKLQAERVLTQMTLQMNYDPNLTRAFLAFDQAASYGHMKLIFYALGQAKIKSYAFQTEEPLTAEVEAHPSHENHAQN